ncbi:MAG TPA: hypothetical protein VH063_12705 [Gaiellaceae bacterium]|jgi:hypothetical protein|nr:hypothetical protein [Gaiellaceae bacterium]
MDYSQLVKKLVVPEGSSVPTRLAYDDVEARMLTRADLAADVRGINESIALIQKTRGGGWPEEAVTEEVNFVDLVWHELEFRDGYSFSYSLYAPGDRYLGCCYLYPLGRRTELTPELADYDVDVSWWVTPGAYGEGYYAKVFAALEAWLASEFPFWRPFYSNRELPSQG